jgi:hypothetical protein
VFKRKPPPFYLEPETVDNLVHSFFAMASYTLNSTGRDSTYLLGQYNEYKLARNEGRPVDEYVNSILRIFNKVTDDEIN